MGHVNLVVFLLWYTVTLIEFIWRLLFVLVFVALLRLSFLLPSLFERVLDHQNLLNCRFLYSRCLLILSVDLWVHWLLSMIYSLSHRTLQCTYRPALAYWMHLDKVLWLQGVVRFHLDCAVLDQHIYVLGLCLFLVLLRYSALLLIWFCFCGAKPLEFGSQFSQWAENVHLGLMLVLCFSITFVQSLPLRPSCVTSIAQHGPMCSMYTMYRGIVDRLSKGGGTSLL